MRDKLIKVALGNLKKQKQKIQDIQSISILKISNELNKIKQDFSSQIQDLEEKIQQLNEQIKKLRKQDA